MVHATDRVFIPFAGAGSGEDELTWGQWEIWRAMVVQQSSLPMGAVRVLSAGTTIDDIVTEIQFYLCRYPSMRTRLCFDRTGRPRQVVAARGEVTLDIVDVADGEDAARIARAVYDDYVSRDFDYADEWPVRTAVVRRDGVPTHFIIVVCHLVADGEGVRVMLRELAEYRSAGRRDAPGTAGSPLDLARREREPPALAHSAAAMRHWAGLLRAMPARRFVGLGAPQQPRYWQLSLDSPSAGVALSRAARRHNADPASVLLTAHAVAVTRVTGLNPFATRVVTNNRFRPGLAELVCPVNQTGLFVVDLAGVSMGEALARTRRRALSAYKYAYYDPARLDETVREVSRERGEELEMACFYNDRRLGDLPKADVRPNAPGKPSGGEEDVVRTELRTDRPTEQFFLHVAGEGDTVTLTLHADTHAVSPDNMRVVLLGMERAIRELADAPDTPTGVPEPPSGAVAGTGRRSASGDSRSAGAAPRTPARARSGGGP